ncbi:alpha-E domain-containing protein [Planotetraspora sp. GP83]|uniref:alpha-E domain-containing protein n=1 Tax=Planotetraspora sp. GP83 TaxID=3156264 RepID=UPI0035190E83
MTATRELLSRIAETLYWIGRYVERADDITRLLDVALRRERPASPENRPEHISGSRSYPARVILMISWES